MNFEEDIRSDNRLVGPEPQRNEPAIDNNLRPQSLDQYIGQEQVRKSLSIFIQAALGRSEPLDHVLFHGFPGLGKTTLAHIIANEMDVNLRHTSGPVLEKAGAGYIPPGDYPMSVVVIGGSQGAQKLSAVVREAIAGRREAFGELVTHFEPSVFAVVQMITSMPRISSISS